MPALNAYAAQHPDLHALAITFDDAKTAHTSVDKRHFRWPVAYGGQALMDKLQVRDYPTLPLLDTQGRQLATRSGGIPSAFMRQVGTHGAISRTGKHDASAESASQVCLLKH